MNLVFFEDAVIHLCRIARVLLQKRGNAMCIGVSGSGKQSLTRLASFMYEYPCKQIKLRKKYTSDDFRKDIKEHMLNAGCDGKQYTFLMTDTQIVNESFLEDINNILNTGEITNLYEQEDLDRIFNDIRGYVKSLKRPETRDVLYSSYIERVRDYFHIIMCMSPVGDSLRIRCRKFPSLVNCCTLNWFDSWPEDALYNVSSKFISNLEDVSDEIKEKLSRMCC
jgi:dynein heavy chain